MQAWFETCEVLACSRTVAAKKLGRYRWPTLEDLSLDLLGRTAIEAGTRVREAATRTLEETSYEPKCSACARTGRRLTDSRGT